MTLIPDATLDAWQAFATNADDWDAQEAILLLIAEVRALRAERDELKKQLELAEEG